jgi:hypothetical protein
MKKLLFVLLSFVQLSVFGTDISNKYDTYYKQQQDFTSNELEQLKSLRIVLVPGILSETFLSQDHRSRLNLSVLTSDYFNAQKYYFDKKYNLDIVRINSSSTSLEEIKINIDDILKKSISENKKVLFVTHSLGGIALMDYLVQQHENHDQFFGNIFLQSPFRGTPIAEVYKNNRLFLRSILRPVIPYLNGHETIADHLDPELRVPYMQRNRYEIQNFVKNIPTITVAAIANGSYSLFKPAIDIIKYGCIRAFRKFCTTSKLHYGQLDDNDGMVPLKSTYISNADHVILRNVDHGETVVNVAFQNIDRARMTEALIKIIIEKQK